LKADVSERWSGWSDIKIIAALDTSASMVYRLRKQPVEEGFAALLNRKQRATPVPRIFDSEKEAKIDRDRLLQSAQEMRTLDLAAFGEQGWGEILPNLSGMKL
jgi:hypothetical protein